MRTYAARHTPFTHARPVGGQECRQITHVHTRTRTHEYTYLGTYVRKQMSWLDEVGTYWVGCLIAWGRWLFRVVL